MPRTTTTSRNRRRQRPPRGALSADSLTETAYRVLKEQILTCQLMPGAPLPSDHLTRQLGLSRTPIREAILRLEKEGFVEVRPRMGTFVSHLNVRDIHEMYEVRSALEALAARQVAGRIDRERLAAVEARLRALPIEGDVDLAALSEAGQGVHRLIVESSDNAVLVRFLQSLRDHFRRYRSLSLAIPEKVLSSHQEHLDILAALKSGDGEAAARLIEAHFSNAAQFLLESLMRRPAAVVVA